ncbi:hypothetical protein Q8A73_021201 [Channa argus]|nr:hypothetical protein Q8A73_021201 [Channa argus]
MVMTSLYLPLYMQKYHIPWILRTILAIWHQLSKKEIPELAKCSMLMELLNTYYPIEIDANLRFEEKLALMVEGNINELLIQQKIRKGMLAMAVKESSAMLRDGCKVFFDSLSEHQVPLLILSAGVGDVLEEVIRQNHVFHPNIHVISNYMEFDLTVTFTGQLIHTFNKREGALSQAAGLSHLQGQPKNILTIGFLNDQLHYLIERQVRQSQF